MHFDRKLGTVKLRYKEENINTNRFIFVGERKEKSPNIDLTILLERTDTIHWK